VAVSAESLLHSCLEPILGRNRNSKSQTISKLRFSKIKTHAAKATMNCELTFNPPNTEKGTCINVYTPPDYGGGVGGYSGLASCAYSVWGGSLSGGGNPPGTGGLGSGVTPGIFG
jgi:hypothetical protein